MIHRAITSDKEWQRVLQRMAKNGTRSDKEWQRMTASNNEWTQAQQRVTTNENEVFISAKLPFFRLIQVWYDYRQNKEVTSHGCKHWDGGPSTLLPPPLTNFQTKKLYQIVRKSRSNRWDYFISNQRMEAFVLVIQ